MRAVKQAAVRGLSVLCATALCALLPTLARAALSVEVVDQSAAPLANAVVWVVPASGRYPAHPPGTAVIDQIGREFSPKVAIVQTGTSVTFPNKDNIRHQVYSFSPAKVFELKLYSGVPALPIVFEKPGLVVMGCNIHDRMVGFVQVVDTPWFAGSDEHGIARVDGVPNEDVVVHAWHWRSGDASETVRAMRMTPDAKLRLVVDLPR